MKIKGLENGSYYFSNPVFVNASGLTRGLKIEASYQGKTYNFYYTHFGGRVQVDISEIVKGITPRIKSLKEIEKIYDIITGSTITFLDGSYKITFVFYDATETNISRFNIVPIVINCTFLKGGKLAYQNNIPTKNNLSIGNVFYEGFPNYDFTFQNDLIKGVLLNRDSKTYDDIVYTSHLNNPIFLLFRNSLGGLSRLLFESFEKKISISNSDSFILPNNIAVDVGRPRISFNCKTQLKKINYGVAENLIISDEVYIYNKNILDTSDELIRVAVSSNFDINRNEQTTDFEVTLDLFNNYD